MCGDGGNAAMAAPGAEVMRSDAAVARRDRIPFLRTTPPQAPVGAVAR